MDTLLSHTTALEALRTWGVQGLIEIDQGSVLEIPARVVREAELRDLIDSSPLLQSLSTPLHLLSSETRASRRTRLVHEHLQRDALPQGSIVRLVPGVCCVSPEHLAVQMSFSLTLLELTVLLCELLGLYAVCPSSEKGMYQRERPLMTPESLLAHLEALGPRKRTRLVRRALAMACVRSGSPRETKLSLRLSLRPELGGYGLSVLSMNEPVEVERIHDRLKKGRAGPTSSSQGRNDPAREDASLRSSTTDATTIRPGRSQRTPGERTSLLRLTFPSSL